jgi:hypothetical protein
MRPTGEKVWQERTPGIFTASPVAADGRVYLVSETGGRRTAVRFVTERGWCTMAKPRVGIVCCFVASCSLGLVRADELPFPAVGSRVRVRSAALDSAPLVGTLSAVDQESLTVVPQDGREPSVVARQDIVRLEQSVQPSRKTRGALIGFGVGLAVMLGKAVKEGGCNDGCNGENVAAATLLALSTAAVGGIASPGERWADVALGRGQSRATMSSRAGLRVRLVPQVGRRTGLTVVASF